MHHFFINKLGSCISILLLTILLTGYSVKAQDFYDDDRLWLYLKLDKDIVKKLNAQLTIQNRFHNNVSEFSQLNTNIELSYKFSKHFKAQAGYVYGAKLWPEGYYGFRQQGYLGFLLKWKPQRWTFVYRNLVQAQNKASYDADKRRAVYYYDRNKLTVKYELHKLLELYVAQEFNLPLYRDSDRDLFFNRSRTFFGNQFNFSRNSYLESYFILQQKTPVKATYINRAWIFGITYSHSF
jgi:hypothetical protein